MSCKFKRHFHSIVQYYMAQNPQGLYQRELNTLVSTHVAKTADENFRIGLTNQILNMDNDLQTWQRKGIVEKVMDDYVPEDANQARIGNLNVNHARWRLA